MTLTTTPIYMTDGLERCFSPFARWASLPIRLAMMMTIALQFLPTLIEEADKITERRPPRAIKRNGQQ